MIALIDYGVGNIRAFLNIYKKLNKPIKVATTASDLKNISKIILPGVGNFDYAMKRFKESGMMEQASDLVLNYNVPVLGICVGMQMLAKSSEEGMQDGLGWVDANVVRFDESKISFKTHLPHMGWNDVAPVKSNPLLEGFESKAKFYFLHSYYFQCGAESQVLAETEYGIKFSSIINQNNVYGIQCHPEKSHENGIQLLDNFANL